MSGHVKVHFRIESGVPGQQDVESVWALPVEEGFQIDNIPFYIRGIALGDIVDAEKDEDGALSFVRLAHPSGHSTVRLWFSNEQDVQRIRDQLRAQGCSSELSELPRLVAVDIPPDVSYDDIRKVFDQGERMGLFEYEEGCLGMMPLS